MRIHGVHHVTSIAGDPGRNVDFFTGTLGLRLVKRTVNFDDPHTYHLYYGDAVGNPGTAITFFPSVGGNQGRPGAGQVTTTAFRVPGGSIDYWRDRFDDRDVPADDPRDRFGATVLPFEDPDGLTYELVAVEEPSGEVEPWGEEVPAEHAIRGFHGVTITASEHEPTREVLARMGFERDREEDGRHRYRIAESGPGAVVEVDVDPDAPRGRMGVGCVHHVAFRTPHDESQATWQRDLREAGFQVTEVKDRQYFRSIYFREPGGVLFEIATDGPGFTRDEDRDSLGEALRLPPWLADDRETIERHLPAIDPTEATR